MKGLIVRRCEVGPLSVVIDEVQNLGGVSVGYTAIPIPPSFCRLLRRPVHSPPPQPSSMRVYPHTVRHGRFALQCNHFFFSGRLLLP